MIKMTKGLSLLALAGLLAMPASANAQRGETALPGRLVVSNECLFSRLSDLDGELPQRQEGLGALLLPILAGVAGDLAGSAVEGLAGAIQDASQEHAYTATGSDGYFAGTISSTDRARGTRWSFSSQKRCLMFHVPGDRGEADTVPQFLAQARENGLITIEQEADLIEAGLAQAGIGSVAPDVYVEIALIPEGDAYFLRPMVVWYRNPISGAGSRSRPTEMTVTLATPSFAADGDALGTLFAIARFQLPRMRPGQGPYKRTDLAGLGTSYIPARPETGTVESQVNGANAAEVGFSASAVALLAADRGLEAARVKLSETNNSTNRAAFIVARDNALDARRAHATATEVIGELRSQDTGTTNARVSFIVIRNPNKFGLAIAAALGAQKDNIDEAVTATITGQPAWRELDTQFLTNMLDVQTKQAALDVAEEGGEPTEILTARNALLISKANANQAAVAAGESPPFPDLLSRIIAGAD